jgi:hypothetical protein
MSGFTAWQFTMVCLHASIYYQTGFDPCLFFAGGHTALFFVPGLSGDRFKAKRMEATP